MDQSYPKLINTKRNRDLLREYLYKDYRKRGLSKEDAMKKMKYLMQKYSDNLFGEEGLAWSLGKRSLTFFNLYFLQDLFVNEDDCAPLAPIHFQIWDDIEDMVVRNTHSRQGYILPRGTGKSAFGNLAPVTWTSVYGIKRYILIGSSIGSTARKFIKQVKDAIEDNIYIESAFGKLIDPSNRSLVNNSEALELSNNVTIESISSTSPMRGRKTKNNVRVELLVLDDFQDDDDVRMAAARDQKWKRFSDDATKAIQKPKKDANGKIIRQAHMLALGTLQHPEDFYSRLYNDPTWKFRKEKGVLIEDVDDFFNEGLWMQFKKLLNNKDDKNRLDTAKRFYYDHEEEMKYPLLWDSYWDCLDYALDYFSNPASFNQEVQARLDSKGHKKFTTVITESPESIEKHDFTKTMLVIDPAGTDVKVKSKKNYFAFIVGSLSESNIRYVRKSEIHKMEYNEYMDKTLQLLKSYPDITHISIEKNVYSGADVLRLQELVKADKELSKRKFTWINKQQTKNKDDKIDTIVADVNMGRIIFNEEDEAAIEQLQDFAGCEFSKYDDFPDCLAEFAKQVLEIEVRKPIKTLPRSVLF
ncbi:hypothetical protein [Cytobacillus oceanisediminis]|uniref:hypothetical protein n=1 Tax=Cytobacillus oceanisediminis TaxID=665099 RepID=UPI002040B681|nr:hypothetical protein [Cytobacillus oceanisediminis]MCM3394858.1 hypothetical protein [Cytobacillus oceanisediminis]